MGKHRETETEEGGRRLSGWGGEEGGAQRGPTDQKARPPEEIGDSQHTATPPSSHIIQTLSNASSLVGSSPGDHDDKEGRVNNVPAADAAVGGGLSVGDTTSTAEGPRVVFSEVAGIGG